MQALPLHAQQGGVENESDAIFRERCLDSLFDSFSECCKRREALQRAETEARQKCEIETRSLEKKADQLANTVQEEIERCGTLLKEALSATQEHASARTKQIQCEVKSVMAQADLDIAKTRMELPGRLWLKKLMAARSYALYGDAMKDARSRYLDAYEGAIREHEASLMAEDMELVALHLSWRTKRVTSTRSCKLNLDEKWTQRINLCQQRAAPVRSAYEASKRTCRDDLQTECAIVASELSSRREDGFKKGAEQDAKIQKLVDAITHQRDKELAKLEAKITEIEKERRRQVQKLRDDYRTHVSSLDSSVQLGLQSLLSAIEKRQKVFDRERDIISKDLRAVQATLTLMTSAIQTFGQDPNSHPDKRTSRPPSNPDGSGACPCGCGRWCGPNHRDQRPNRFTGSFFAQFPGMFNFDARQRTYEKFEGQRRADESRRQREVDEDELRRNEERLEREKAEAQARAERETRERLREQAKRRQEEETRKRDEEARRKREDEERRRAEADRRARGEEERKRREEEERKQREEDERKQREEDERKRREEDERKRREEDERKRREEEERKRREEEERKQREEGESRRRAEEEREDARRREEEESRRREESQQDRQQQQHSSNGEGEDAQGATSENDIDDDGRSGGTRGDSTARGRTKFVRKCWNKYTDAWGRLIASGVLRLRFQEIPWPILPPRKRPFVKMSITDILSRISKESIRTFILDPEHLQSISPKARIRKELLRFHPDKRNQWLKNVKDEEKEQVDDACKQIVLHLTDLLNTAA